MRAIASPLPRARAYAVSSDLPPVRGRGPKGPAVAGPFVGLFLQQGNAGSVSRFEWHGTVLETREHLEVSPCLRDQSEKTFQPPLAGELLIGSTAALDPYPTFRMPGQHGGPPLR